MNNFENPFSRPIRISRQRLEGGAFRRFLARPNVRRSWFKCMIRKSLNLPLNHTSLVLSLAPSLCLRIVGDDVRSLPWFFLILFLFLILWFGYLRFEVGRSRLDVGCSGRFPNACVQRQEPFPWRLPSPSPLPSPLPTLPKLFLLPKPQFRLS